MHILHRLIEKMQWTHRGAGPTVSGMFGNAVPLVLTVGSGVLYHLTLKSQSGSASPWAFLTAAYAVALVLAGGAWIASGALGGGTMAMPALDRRVLIGAALLGLAAIGIELGVYLAYRAGWGLGTLSMVNAGSVAAVLCLIGVTLSGESMSPSRAVGLVVALGGIWLLAKR